jgi:hypothetical protein
MTEPNSHDLTADRLAEPNTAGFDEVPVSPLGIVAIGDIRQRLTQIENQIPEVTKIIGSVVQLGANLQQLQQIVHQMSQQRAVAELQMERNIRASALDLAIKALQGPTKESPADLDKLTTFAGAFLAYMKAGDH